MKRPRLVFGAAILVATGGVLWGTSRSTTESLTRPAVATDAGAATRGGAAFEGAAFGGIGMDALASNAVPWRLVAAALVLDERARDPSAALNKTTLDRVLRRFGFLMGATIVNRPPGASPAMTGLPLGMTAGDVAPIGGSVVRVANLGCAACHAGVTYASDGRPLPDRAMLGMPNSSIDLEGYTMAIFRALRRFADSDQLLSTAGALYPEMSWRERASLRLLVLPLARKRLAQLSGADRPLPFSNGTPGSTNGVAALKVALAQPLIGGGRGDAGVVSIPDLGDRVWRTSLLSDGAYAIPGKPRQAPTTQATIDDKHLRALAEITTFFTVPSMGVHPDKAVASLGDATDIIAFLKGYRPQRFPGSVNIERAGAGEAVYARHCAACHGSYSNGPEPRLARYPNWQGEVGTDPLRSTVFDSGLSKAVAGTVYRTRVAAQWGGGYVAPPLTGVWASAPYLHNGSVPTLAALLAPATRPTRFMVGGHALDYVSVGLRLDANGAYRQGYRPFSQPVWIDTREAGRGNKGHIFGATLSAQEQAALIEYLKLL